MQYKIIHWLLMGFALTLPALRAQLPQPDAEGWESEAFNDSISDVLKDFAEAILCEKNNDRLDEFFEKEAVASPLRPEGSSPKMIDAISVMRGATDDHAAPVAMRMAELLRPFAEGRATRVKFKVHNASPEEQRSEQFVSITGRAVDGKLVEQNLNWRIQWKGVPGGWKMASITAIEQERAEEVVAANQPVFSDATAAVLGRDETFRSQYLLGNNEWYPRIDAFNRFFIFGLNGLAIGDVNGDDLEDVYSPQTGGLPNRLFIQQPDGSLVEGAAAAGVDFLDSTRAALFVDLDNDGDQDLVLGLNGGLMILRNDGTGKFEPRLRYPQVTNGFGLAAADYDLDGDLDLFVCRYFGDSDAGAQLAVPAPYFDANNGGSNFLLRNDGGGAGATWISFTDATEISGLALNGQRFSYAAVWDDFDADADPDLYVVNDFGKNVLYLNEGGQFTDATVAVGLEDSAFGMSASSGDFDRNGVSDLYVGNMFSAAGSRITRQKNFRDGRDEGLRGEFQRLARGNSLFSGALDPSGKPGFTDVSVGAGVTLGRWSWGSIFLDLNNDGWEDLFVANGFITGRQPDDL